VGFAEFTGRDVRMPVSLRPCDPILPLFLHRNMTIQEHAKSFRAIRIGALSQYLIGIWVKIT
jgi:hypothetical protein